jgi:histidine triad (HIT) family protein
MKLVRLLLLFLLGVFVGQLDPLGWAVARLAVPRLVAIKEASLAAPSPFEKVARERFIAESANAIAFPDCAPLARVHALVVPKQRYPTLLETPAPVLAEMFELVKEVARRQGIAESGFRVMINTNPDANQTVYHTHMHVMGGEPLGFPVLATIASRISGSCP